MTVDRQYTERRLAMFKALSGADLCEAEVRALRSWEDAADCVFEGGFAAWYDADAKEWYRAYALEQFDYEYKR